jgi:hypothetical protein
MQRGQNMCTEKMVMRILYLGNVVSEIFSRKGFGAFFGD